MTTKKEQRRVKIKYRVRNKISGTAARPRLTVFRSNKQIYVQIINDETSSTLVSASSLGMEAMPKKEQAAKVGEAVAAKAIAAGITEVVFDRNGYLYHGRVKEVADGARKEPHYARHDEGCDHSERHPHRRFGDLDVAAQLVRRRHAAAFLP